MTIPSVRRTPAEWIDLADRNLADFARHGAVWDRRGEIEVRGDLQLVSSGTRFPAGMFNSAMPLSSCSDPALGPAWLSQAARYFAARERGFSMYVRDDRHPALEQACVAANMPQGGAPPGMLLAAALPEKELPEDTRIEKVTDARGLSDFAAVAAAGFALHGLPEPITRKILADAERVLAPELSCYVAYVGDRPASCAMSRASHGIAGLYWIATHPDLHRRSLGSAVTRHASNAAFAVGAAAVILQASTHGEPVYRRLGFQTICRYRWYFMTAEQAAAHAAG